MLREWDKLPRYMRTKEVRPYYEKLKNKKAGLIVKRSFDIIVSALMILLLIPIFIIISFAILRDSKGGIFYCQERITQYGKKFKIIKFRTMVKDADKKGSGVTVSNDSRVTKVGSKLRKYRLDELPQLINILLGDMTFVGTRPESTYYVTKYSKEMFATLLLPAGVTSEACIKYKDEAELLDKADDVDRVYIDKILPEKMKYNLRSIRKFSWLRDIYTMFRTAFVVFRKNNNYGK
ncbi:sugar transferase [Lachnoanaerobaculum sp. JCM 36186]|jgi:hypothetical protein|uniref:sugar transferase n=1 Tax=Lachnoanaerobaculum sanguinis TaxID=3065809 RepID=UPI002751B95E|nr:sugar transferase [Lachnoanaerobaculum sp. JCM 36186]GMO02085.1 sugar transferase [Lachnoanaerobaculum sp. JCM 36186]